MRMIGSLMLVIYTAIADIAGALLSFAFGAIAVPWIWTWIVWGTTGRTGPTPSFVSAWLHPSLLLGAIWLIYYALTLLILLIPDEFVEETRKIYADKQPGQSDPPARSVPPLDLPLSRAIPGAPHWQHIEHCYALFRTALSAWSPPPVKRLKTPARFSYYQGDGPILWSGRTLILPEAMLQSPEALSRRQADLARELGRYTFGDLRLRAWMALTPRRTSAFFVLTGNFVWLPRIVHASWERWQAERTLQLDCFVHWTGQGSALLHELLARRQDNQQKNLTDTSWPTLSERIDQLEMLLGIEQEQKENQGIRPKAEPAAAAGALAARSAKRVG